MSQKMVRTDWPGEWKSGDAVIHQDRAGHVVSLPVTFMVSAGCVPVMYDDEEGCFVMVPADDLNHRFKMAPSKPSKRIMNMDPLETERLRDLAASVEAAYEEACVAGECNCITKEEHERTLAVVAEKKKLRES